ncbi:MAG TPA: hypothetical protein VK966_02555, partial [Longimicrobiales bacterium]|nr:hypothetical protein [Longimicrobiales bacterium]
MRTTLTAVLALAAAFVTPLAGLLEAQSAPLGAGTAQSARQAFGPLAADDPDLAARIDTMALRAHTRFLADDALAGRGAGTTGERVAAAYIASRLA